MCKWDKVLTVRAEAAETLGKYYTSLYCFLNIDMVAHIQLVQLSELLQDSCKSCFVSS